MFGRSRRETPVDIGQRLTVPVMAASGGSGRSTVAALIASVVARHARTLVLDCAPGVLSPWGGWISRPGTGIASVHDTELPAAQALYAAASRMEVGDDVHYSVLTDTRERDAPPLMSMPMEAWKRLAEVVTPRCLLVDTQRLLLPELASLRGGWVPTDAAAWLTEPDARPVLCAPATARGIDDALLAVTGIEELGLGPERVVVAVLGLPATDLPRRVLAGLTLLQPRVARVVRIPHDRRIRATGEPRPDRIAARTRRALQDLAHAVTAPVGRPGISITSERGGTSHAVATTG